MAICADAQELSFKRLLSELEQSIAYHDNLHPFGAEYVCLKDFGVSTKIWKRLMDKNVALTDSVDVFEMQWYFQERIAEIFLDLVNHPNFSADSLSSSFMVSSDGKFIQLSYFGNTGGSYKSNISHYYHTGLGKVNFQQLDKAFSQLSSDGYYEVYTLQSAHETQYLVLGGVIGCNTCMSAYAELFHFSDSTIVSDFSSEIGTRLGISGFHFDTVSKALSINWDTSDLAPYCFCETSAQLVDDGPEIEADFDFERDTKSCACMYKYTGNTFTLVEHAFEAQE